MAPSTANGEGKPKGTARMVFYQALPYRKWLLLIFIAMVVQTVMDIANPWPLKIIIDNVIRHHSLPSWLQWLNASPINGDKMKMALIAAISLVVIAVIGSLAAYAYSYFTESVAQYIA